MDADASVIAWSDDSDDDDSDVEVCDEANRNSGNTRPQQHSQRRPARVTLPFVPYADWDADQSYDELPPSCMHYLMDWKLTLNRRLLAKQTEDALVVAPSDFWNEKFNDTRFAFYCTVEPSFQ